MGCPHHVVVIKGIDYPISGKTYGLAMSGLFQGPGEHDSEDEVAEIVEFVLTDRIHRRWIKLSSLASVSTDRWGTDVHKSIAQGEIRKVKELELRRQQGLMEQIELGL